jgi:hypothetical protein
MKEGLADNGEVSGYICTPHSKLTPSLLELWKKNSNIAEIYFAAATFSAESLPYFPNKANNYVLASFSDIGGIAENLSSRYGEGQQQQQLILLFSLSSPLFERIGDRLNYVSLYFTKYSNGDEAISDLAKVIARRDRVMKASLAEMKILSNERPRFVFPYSKNVVILEVQGTETHQMDQKYCEKTRRDVIRKGILLNNLVSFSILEKLK